MTTYSIPVRVDSSTLKKIILKSGFALNDQLAAEVTKYITVLDYSVKKFMSDREAGRDKAIREYNKKIDEFLENTGGRISNVTGIILQTKKGDTQFTRALPIESLLRKLLAGPEPAKAKKHPVTGRIIDDHIARLKYHFTDDIVFPLQKRTRRDADQLMRQVVEDARHLGAYIYSNLTKDLKVIRQLIVNIITAFYPDLTTQRSAKAINVTFARHFNKQIQSGTLGTPKKQN